jgi:transposase-like protein
MAEKKTRRRYTDEERADLMVMLQSQGYPDKLGALKKVAEYAGIQPNVLRRWWQAKQNPPPNKLVTRKKIDLREAIDKELGEIFVGMKTKREDASYRDLGTVAGILFDKKQLIDNKPTERIAHEHSGNLTVTERRERINELLDRGRTRRTGDTAESGVRDTDD